MVLKWVFGLLRALTSGRKPGEVAGGAAWGLLLALVPGGNLLWAFLFVLTFLLSINVAAALLLAAAFRLLVPLADPLLDRLGYALLTLPALRPFFTRLLELPLLNFTRLNNTLVCGGLAAGLLLLGPAYFAFRVLVVAFRERILARLVRSRWYKWFLRLPLVGKLSLLLRRLARLYPGSV
jgi:uncharacterized protein (TIGR03546 family)